MTKKRTSGLGKGLDSLIPDFYNEDFDSNSSVSLEDMLNEKEEIDLKEKPDEKNIDNEKIDSSDNDFNTEVLSKEDGFEDLVSQKDDSKDEVENEDLQSSTEIENIEDVKKIVAKNPRITLWSSQSAAVFRYLRKTEPEFSISKEASILIDDAVSKKYPEIWKLFEDI